MITVLFADLHGVYSGRSDVDLWDRTRDARLYAGPFPVVAHPPCERWGRWWWADGSESPGNDGGCFASALASVETYGGVIEHPAFSHAWGRFNLPHPDPAGGWTRNLYRPGWSCHVAQRNYGHRARKDTWLYYVGPLPPPLVWGPGDAPEAYLCPPGRRGPDKPGRTDVERISAVEARSTPLPFAELLLDLARRSAAREAA